MQHPHPWRFVVALLPLLLPLLQPGRHPLLCCRWSVGAAVVPVLCRVRVCHTPVWRGLFLCGRCLWRVHGLVRQQTGGGAGRQGAGVVCDRHETRGRHEADRGSLAGCWGAWVAVLPLAAPFSAALWQC